LLSSLSLSLSSGTSSTAGLNRIFLTREGFFKKLGSRLLIAIHIKGFIQIFRSQLTILGGFLKIVRSRLIIAIQMRNVFVNTYSYPSSRPWGPASSPSCRPAASEPALLPLISHHYAPVSLQSSRAGVLRVPAPDAHGGGASLWSCCWLFSLFRSPFALKSHLCHCVLQAPSILRECDGSSCLVRADCCCL
jgi:hypothetical protein